MLQSEFVNFIHGAIDIYSIVNFVVCYITICRGTFSQPTSPMDSEAQGNLDPDALAVESSPISESSTCGEVFTT